MERGSGRRMSCFRRGWHGRILWEELRWGLGSRSLGRKGLGSGGLGRRGLDSRGLGGRGLGSSLSLCVGARSLPRSLPLRADLKYWEMLCPPKPWLPLVTNEESLKSLHRPLGLLNRDKITWLLPMSQRILTGRALLLKLSLVWSCRIETCRAWHKLTWSDRRSSSQPSGKKSWSGWLSPSRTPKCLHLRNGTRLRCWSYSRLILFCCNVLARWASFKYGAPTTQIQYSAITTLLEDRTM